MGPWPTPVLDRIDPLVAEVVSSFSFFGYRKVWGALRLDGHEWISASSVRRSMGRRGLLQPRRPICLKILTRDTRRTDMWSLRSLLRESDERSTMLLRHAPEPLDQCPKAQQRRARKRQEVEAPIELDP